MSLVFIDGSPTVEILDILAADQHLLICLAFSVTLDSFEV